MLSYGGGFVVDGYRKKKGITIYIYIFNGEFERNLIRFGFTLTKSYFYLILTSSGAPFLRLISSVKLYADVNLIFPTISHLFTANIIP